MMRVEDCVRALCFPDPHAGPDGSYTIRSLYLDSPGRLYYLQTRNGEDKRLKYRIRIYNGSDSRIALERKESLHGKKSKAVSVISREVCDSILSGKEFDPADDDLMIYAADRAKNLLAPSAVIEYIRDAYVHPVGNVRITFDRRILASSSEDLFAESLAGTDVLRDGSGILEVKYDDVLPGAIGRMLRPFDLQPVSFSKYVGSIDAINGNMGDPA